MKKLAVALMLVCCPLAVSGAGIEYVETNGKTFMYHAGTWKFWVGRNQLTDREERIALSMTVPETRFMAVVHCDEESRPRVTFAHRDHTQIIPQAERFIALMTWRFDEEPTEQGGFELVGGNRDDLFPTDPDVFEEKMRRHKRLVNGVPLNLQNGSDLISSVEFDLAGTDALFANLCTLPLDKPRYVPQTKEPAQPAQLQPSRR